MRTPIGRRTLFVFLGGLAIVAFLVKMLIDSWTYQDASYVYANYAAAYESNDQEIEGMESCYGVRWDNYSETIRADRNAHWIDKSYMRSKAGYYKKLQRKYERASSRPWVPIRLDPPVRAD
jgi:hypothetical protein